MSDIPLREVLAANSADMQRKLAAALARVARLEAALREVADGKYVSDWRARRIARAALEVEP